MNVASQVYPASPRTGAEAGDTRVLPAQVGEAFQASYIPTYVVPKSQYITWLQKLPFTSQIIWTSNLQDPGMILAKLPTLSCYIVYS